MIWDEKQLHWHLTTRRFGRQFRYFEEIDSTNRWLMQHPEAFTLSGGVAVAGHQINGRGRNSREWLDASGGALLFSISLKLRDNQSARGFLSLIPAIALARVLKKHNRELDVSLKWPNDVLIDHKKVAGILAETTKHENDDVVIIGVGINVSAIPPQNFIWPATSIFEQTKWHPSREILLAELLNEWEPLFDIYLDGDTQLLRDAWEKLGPPRGSTIKRVDGQHTVVGVFEGLGVQGQLVVKDSVGNLHDVFSGDVVPA